MRTLVYYTIGRSRKYIDMLDLSVQSLRKVYSGDIGVLCDESFVEECETRFPDVLLWPLPDAKTGVEASMNKVKVFDFLKDDEYDAVIYLDTDILVMKPLPFEDITNPDVLYAYTENHLQTAHTLIYWSLRSYTPEQLEFMRVRKILPFNAGTFGFVPSAEMRRHFDNVRELIRTHTGDYFYEQSFLNVYFNPLDKTNRSVLTMDVIKFNPPGAHVFPNATIVHFANASQSGETKCNRMTEYLDRWNKFVALQNEPVRIFPSRDAMLSIIPENGVYAEIGVFEGKFADTICGALQPSRLVLLDLFSGVVGSGDQDGNNMKFIDTRKVYDHFVRVSKRFPALEVVKGDSSTNLAKYPDNTFDMVYIDGDHSYEGVKKDIEVAYRKVKSGGWILGHDYEMNFAKAKHNYDFGVKQAVDEFCEKYNQRISAKGMDGCVSFGICLLKPDA